jgi:hypothetical protein
VRDRVEQLADISHDIELFEELATKRLLMRFARMDLPAGKLPMSFEVRA